MGSLAPFNYATATLNTAFPTIPTGNYYVGWILDSGGSVNEFLENNNTGYLRNSQLTVGTDDHGNNAGPPRKFWPKATRVPAIWNSVGIRLVLFPGLGRCPTSRWPRPWERWPTRP